MILLNDIDDRCTVHEVPIDIYDFESVMNLQDKEEDAVDILILKNIKRVQVGDYISFNEWYRESGFSGRTALVRIMSKTDWLDEMSLINFQLIGVFQ